MMIAQTQFYEAKLAYEMDPADLFEGLQKGEDLIPLDTRKAVGYQREHIPGAMNLPHRLMSPENTNHLDRSKTYVCYCDGIGCNASTKGSLKMTRLGFKVKELIGGIEWWKFDGYATEGSHASNGTEIKCVC